VVAGVHDPSLEHEEHDRDRDVISAAAASGSVVNEVETWIRNGMM